MRTDEGCLIASLLRLSSSCFLSITVWRVIAYTFLGLGEYCDLGVPHLAWAVPADGSTATTAKPTFPFHPRT